MNYRKIIYLSSLLTTLTGAVKAQVLSGSNLNITMASNAAPGLTVTSKAPPPYTSPTPVNVIEGWAGGSGFVVGVPPPKLVFSVNNYGNAIISNSLRIGATAANGTYSNYSLSVDGDMIARRCVIQVSNWADYVFNSDYTLPDLSEVECFIAKNKHLPGVPSEKDALENGVEIGKMNEILLKKIEELTLYQIEQNKKIEYLLKKTGQQ